MKRFFRKLFSPLVITAIVSIIEIAAIVVGFYFLQKHLDGIIEPIIVLVAIRIVEDNIFIFQPAKGFKIRVYLEKKVLYLRKIKIISQLVVEARRSRIPAIIRIGKDHPLEVLNKVIIF